VRGTGSGADSGRERIGSLVELLWVVGDRLLAVTPDAVGRVRSEVLGVQFVTVEERCGSPGTTASPTSELALRGEAASGNLVAAAP
jgi:hypothetical protein